MDKAQAGPPLGAPVPGWTDRPRPARKTMTGRLCLLESFDSARHGQGLFDALAQDPALWTYLPTAMPQTASMLADRLAAANAGAAPLFQTFVIRDAACGDVLGMASYMRIDPAAGSIEVGFVVYGPRLQRSAAATEAQYLMARHVFEDLGYRRYEWKCNALNAASRAAADRLGFRFEGVFRNAMVAQGRSRDTAWYAMTDADWPVAGAVLRGWLEPDNFDAGGRALTSLRAAMLRARGAVEAQPIIDALGLQPHPEGGWYRETWRDTPADGSRGAGTAIHYLLRAGERSHWHKVDAAEIWHWHAGAPLALAISADGHNARTLRLGGDVLAGEQPHGLVPAGAWQSAETTGAWSLISCTVAPAFRFEGFDLAPPNWEPRD